MKKIDGFTQRGPHSTRYPFPQMAEQLDVVWELAAGQDYHNGESAARRAAHQWADRHGLKAHTSVPREGGRIEIMFVKGEADG